MTPTQHEHAFMGALAGAITQWQIVELELYRVFSLLIRCEKPEVGSAVFHSFANFDMRLGMTHAAALIELKGCPLFGRWVDLHNRMRKRARRRDELAHFMLRHCVHKSGELFFALEPSIFDATGDVVRKIPRYSLRFIEAIERSFGGLSEDVHSFTETLSAAGTLHVKTTKAPDLHANGGEFQPIVVRSILTLA